MMKYPDPDSPEILTNFKEFIVEYNIKSIAKPTKPENQ